MLFSNSEMSHKDIEKYVVINDGSRRLLNLAVEKMKLSARSYFRILKVSRTIADLDQSVDVQEKHIAEALSYRVEIS